MREREVAMTFGSGSRAERRRLRHACANRPAMSSTTSFGLECDSGCGKFGDWPQSGQSGAAG